MKEFIENLVGQSEAADAILAEHQRILAQQRSEMEQLRRDSAVQIAVSAAGGRNVAAIRAVMDESAIAESEDIHAAAKAAVAQVRREHPYLFAALSVTAPGTGLTPAPRSYTQEELGKMSLAEYRRYRKGM